MKLKYIYLLLVAYSCFSCKNATSERPNYITDIEIDNNGLSCDGITMENHTGSINKSEFSYGEKITLFYKNMTGFALQDSLAYPNMDIFITDKKGDTIVSQTDLFKNIKEGFTEEDLNLRNNLMLGSPMKTGNSYQMHINIIDTKGDGYFNLKKDFSIVKNPLFKATADGLTYDVLYLYSQKRDIAIVDDKISPEESMLIVLQNLDGYEIDENGKVDLSASISLIEADGRIINENNDLFKEPVNAKELKDQLYASLVITNGKVYNPVTCTFKVKDRKSGHSFETSIDLIVTQLK